jgi:hypothetical protein
LRDLNPGLLVPEANAMSTVPLRQGGSTDGLFSNQTHRFGTFGKPFELNILIYFMTIWYSLWPFAIFYCNLVYVVAISQIIPILVLRTKKNLATLTGEQQVFFGQCFSQVLFFNAGGLYHTYDMIGRCIHINYTFRVFFCMFKTYYIFSYTLPPVFLKKIKLHSRRCFIM